jgi:hypothetical protein
VLRRAVLALTLVVALVAAGGVAVARSAPELRASGPTSVTGTEASGVFQIADRTIRQVRYADHGTLRYTFEVTNDNRLPLTILGLAAGQSRPRLFSLDGLSGPDGADRISIGAGDTTTVTLDLGMSGCETLSARAGSFVTQVVVRTEQAGVFDDDVNLRLPEELHTGSPREAFCPESTATSRPPG